MATRRKLNFGQMVRDFNNLQLTGSPDIRAKCDEIVRIILGLINSTGGGTGDPGSGGGGSSVPPPAPDGLGAQGFLKSVRIAWSAVTGAASYRIYRGLSQGGPWTLIDTVTVNGYLDTGLEDETAYYYYVTALSANQLESDPSEVAFGTTLPDDTVGTPGVITGLTASTVNSFDVTLEWDAFDANTVSAEIQRLRVTAAVPTWVTIATGLTGLIYDDVRVNDGLRYQYRIRGINEAGTAGDWSAEIDVETPAYDDEPPSVPTMLTPVPGARSLTVGCTESPEPDLRGYVFAIGTAPGGPYTSQPERRPANTVFPGLAASTTYYVVARSVDTSNNLSAWSNEVSGTTLADPVGDTTPPPRVSAVNAFSRESGEVTLQWSEVYASDLAGYTIEVSGPPAGTPTGPFVFARDVAAGSFNTTFTGLQPLARYSYRVFSKDTTGNLALPSPVATVTPDGAAGPAGSTISLNTFGASPLDSVIADANPVLVGSEPTPNDPIAGITANGTNGSTVHSYAYNSAEANKELFIDTIRANRAARPNGPERATYNHTNAVSYYNAFFEGRWNWALNLGKSGAYPVTATPHNNMYVLDNCEFLSWPYATAETLTNWAVQNYDQPASLCRNTDFGGVRVGPYGWREENTVPPPFAPDEALETYPGRYEHDEYHHTGNTCIWQGNTSREIGGHTFYIANRGYAYEQYKADNVIPTAPALALVDNCHLVDSNINAAKGSNKIELFDFGNPAYPSYLVVRNSTLVDAFPFWRLNLNGNTVHRSLTRSKATGYHRSMGMIGISGFQWCENPQEPYTTLPTSTTPPNHPSGPPNPFAGDGSPGGFGAGTAPMALALIKNCLIHQQDPGKSFCAFGGVTDVLFEDCTLLRDGVVGSTVQCILVNEQGYKASDPTNTRGLPRTETITFSNCVTRNLSITFKRLAGADLTVAVPEDLRNLTVTYDCSDGSITNVGGVPTAYDPSSDYYDLAGLINTLDPLDGINNIPADFDWGIPGVTAAP